MSTHTNNITLRASAALTGSAGTTYGTLSVRVDKYEELTLFLLFTAQTYDNETLAISVQTKDQVGNWYDLTGAAFTTVGDTSGTARESIGIVIFGSNIRLKYVTTGNTPNYTFSVTGIAKGNF